MARSVYHIDFYTFIINRYILGQNCDTPLSFEIVVVKDQFSQLLLLARLTRLIYHPVHQGCLTVVNMGDNRNVSDVLHIDNV